MDRLARPTGVSLPVLSSSPLWSSSLAFLFRFRGTLPGGSGAASGGGASTSSRRPNPLLVKGRCAPEGTGLETPRPLAPLPMPENMRPNSLLIPGSPAGPWDCGCAPCTACGKGEIRPLRLISPTANNPALCCLAKCGAEPPSSRDRAGREDSKGCDPSPPLYAMDVGGGASSPGRDRC